LNSFEEKVCEINFVHSAPVSEMFPVVSCLSLTEKIFWNFSGMVPRIDEVLGKALLKHIIH